MLTACCRLHEKTNAPLNNIELFLKQLAESNVQSPFLLSMFIDIYEQNAKRDHKPIDPVALEMCTELAEKQDAIREKYWNFKKLMLQKLHIAA
jgi:protein farnesyltransferase/geranylgeranyltransferase type-1 subunit alpha